MTPQERQLLNDLKDRFDKLEKSDRYTILKLIQMLDGRNFQFGRTTGTKLGTASDQKLSVYGVTPIIQQSKINDPSGGGTAGVDAPARNTINAIIDALEAFGISSAT